MGIQWVSWDQWQSARQIGDQLGHARPSLTQGVYMGRKTRNPRAADALQRALEEPKTESTGERPGRQAKRKEP